MEEEIINSKTYMKKYREANLQREEIERKIEEFKKQYPEVFDTLESLEYEIEKIEEDKKQYVEQIKEQMEKENLSKDIVGKYEFTYVAPTIRRNFNGKKFYETYSPKTKMYKEFINESNVAGYVKIKELVYKDDIIEE